MSRINILFGSAVAVLLAVCGLSWAQDAVVSGADVNKGIAAVQNHDWQLLAAALLPAIAWAVRRAQTAEASWAHTTAAKLLLTFAAAALGSLAPVLDLHAFTVQSLLSAVTVGIGAAIAVFNAGPGTVRATFAREVVAAEEGKGPMPVAPKVGPLLILLAAGSLYGCATTLPPGCLEASTAAVLGDAKAIASCGLLSTPVPPPTMECIDDSAAAIAADAKAVLACIPNKTETPASSLSSRIPEATVRAAVANAAKHPPTKLPRLP